MPLIPENIEETKQYVAVEPVPNEPEKPVDVGIETIIEEGLTGEEAPPANTRKVKRTYWTPQQDKLLVEPIDPETVTKSGIIIPYVAQEKQAQGVIVAAGEGMWQHGLFLRTELKPGTLVLYSKHAGHEFKIHDKNYIIIRESDVLLAKLEVMVDEEIPAETTEPTPDPTPEKTEDVGQV